MREVGTIPFVAKRYAQCISYENLVKCYEYLISGPLRVIKVSASRRGILIANKNYGFCVILKSHSSRFGCGLPAVFKNKKRNMKSAGRSIVSGSGHKKT